MIPDFLKTKEVIAKQQVEFFEFRMKFHLGPLFGNMPKKPIYEGMTMEHNYQEGYKYNNELKKMETGFSMPIPELKVNPLLIYNKFDEMAEDFAGQQVRMTIDTISEVTEMTGNKIDAKGEITPDQILAMWEKMEIAFNKDGSPIKYTLLAGTDMLEKFKSVFIHMENDEEYKKKMQGLIDKKRIAWNDRENNRKLVG